ncbi:MAG: RagB/SusD family nutrient uptake outer membrane protein [Tannerella sp.]|jgi:hypothetical protein|nr:RagB/SusD family nutrient uptake outer membrane protein [Tannerella sp.]
MKKLLNFIIFIVVFAVNACLWTGCSDEFLKEKKNYGNLSPDIYNDETGAKMRVEDIYLRLLPNARDGLMYRSPSNGTASDVQTQATEEFTGLSWYVNPDRLPTEQAGNDWFHVNKSTAAGPWGEIRNCNDVIEGLTNSTLPENVKGSLIAQVTFFRAWQYFLLVRTYGGVPIIDHVQATDVSMAQDLAVPRATTRECIDFICADLEKAAAMLPARWEGGDWGRITKGAALALAGRARLLYASPLFNRSDDKARWQAAYDANKAALDALAEGGFGLVNENNPGLNASGFSQIFSQFNSDEAVFVTLYNRVHDDNAAHEIYRNNTREQGLRPANAHGAPSGDGRSTTSMMVDLFPMADGKKPGESSTFAYDELAFFKNRDPRFYRSFAFPGVYWRFQGNPLAWDWGTGFVPVKYNGPDYELWNYVWNEKSETQTDDQFKGFGADLLGNRVQGVYVRKRSNDFDLSDGFTSVALYRWPATQSENRVGAFGEGAFPHMEIRYAEVLLNLAESACGIDQLNEAFSILKRIRARAGYDAAIAGADYGLNPGASRGEMFGAIMYERQIEFAYEGKRFEDMRRWLLWDGGTNFSQVAGAPSTWNLSGFGGNTCTYLGVEPLNGKRRDSFVLRTMDTAPENHDSDPVGADRPATALDLKKSFADQTAVIDALANFYTTRLVRKTIRGDEINKTVLFQPRNYFIGLTTGAQQNNQTLLQTIGWADFMNGNANGTYDPLAE